MNAPSSTAARPGFGAILRGVWLLTWRGRWTWRGMGWPALALFILPALAYICAAPYHRESMELINEPEAHLQRVAHGLERGGFPLSAKQRADLEVVFNEEYARARKTETADLPSAEAARAQIEELNEWNRRLTERVEAILEPRQFARFQTSQKQLLKAQTREVNRPRWSSGEAFYRLLIDFYFLILFPFECVRSCGALIRDELQADTLGFLLTRPAPRFVIVLAKYISQVFWLYVHLLVQTLLLFAVGAWRDVPSVWGVLGWFLVAQTLAAPAWSALGLLLGLLTNRYVAVALVYGAVVEFGVGLIPTNIKILSLSRQLQTLLANNSTLQSIFDWSDVGVWTPVAALLVGTLLFLGGAAALFTFREYHQNAEMQK